MLLPSPLLVKTLTLPNQFSQLTPGLTGSKSKKNKKKKNAKAKSNGDLSKSNGVKMEEEKEDNDADEEEPETLAPSEPQSPSKANVSDIPGDPHGKSAVIDGRETGSLEKDVTEESNGVHRQNPQSKRNSLANPPSAADRIGTSSIESDARLTAMVNEREALRQEVTQVRQSLEDMQERHEIEMSNIREQLSQTEEGKEQAETQYQNLLGKVNTIRSQLGERLKADAVCWPVWKIDHADHL